MKLCYTQKEFISLLETNPLNLPVYYSEVIVDNADDYIFFDAIIDIPIKFDDSAIYVNQIQLQVYGANVDDFNKTCAFLKKHFVADIEYTKDDYYNIATFTINVMISDWNNYE